jgi:hypothetical protein
MQNMSLSEEPEDMDDIREELEEEMIDDEDLPQWAKRSNFVDDRLGMFGFEVLPLYHTHLLCRSCARSSILLPSTGS